MEEKETPPNSTIKFLHSMKGKEKKKRKTVRGPPQGKQANPARRKRKISSLSGLFYIKKGGERCFQDE